MTVSPSVPGKHSWKNYYVAILIIGSLFACQLLFTASASSSHPASGNTQGYSEYDRLLDVKQWEVDLHLVYDNHWGTTTEHTISDWTGMLHPDDPFPSGGVARWYEDLDVTVDGSRQSRCETHGQTKLVTVHTTEKYSFAIRIKKDGYEFSQGNCNTEPGHGVTVEQWCRACDPKPPNPAFESVTYSSPWRVQWPLPSQGLTLSGSTTTKCEDGATVNVTWNFHPVGQNELKAIPAVASSVERGGTVILDGTKSQGKIKEYKWTFRSKGGTSAGSDAPNENAEKKGSKSSVILLDSMDVTLTVSDGNKTDKKTVSVKVTPRKDFRTPFEHVSEEGTLPNSDRPSCRVTGKNAKGEKEYTGGWVGGENNCAIDPPASSAEPAHIFHPDPEKAGKDDLYTLAIVEDSNGPWDGFYYFKDWKLVVKRKTFLNMYIVVNAPPVFAGMSKNFYQANVERRNDVAGYLEAVRKHEKQHSDLMQQALAAGDPAKDVEKAYGKDNGKLRQDANSRIRDAAKRVHERAKDPLPEIWHGILAVPQDDTYEWRSFEQHIGGSYTIDF